MRMLLLLFVGGIVTVGVLANGPLQPYLQPLLTRVTESLPFLKKSERHLEGLVTETVKRGPFRITVTERGTLDSLKNAVIASKVEGSNTIISIVPEGAHVKSGDLICELDSSAMVEKETQQQISVTQAESGLQSAKETVEIQKTQNDSDIAAAELKLKLAELDLKKFEQGDYETQFAELDAQVKLSAEKVAQALENYEFTERLVKKGYKTQNELESVRISLQTEQINMKIAEGKRALLETFTRERTLTELKANAAEFKRELSRVERKAKAALAQAEADYASKRLTHDVEVSKHNRLKEQIAFCKIYATQEGQVVYANSRDGRGSDQVLVEEGAAIRERQPIVYLPDLSEMKVNARIHESRISLIKAGLSATVKVDAYPDDEFRAVIDTVASVPSSTGSFFSRDLKEYEAVIRLHEAGNDVSRLRPGLTAEIVMLVSSREDVLQAPIQSVMTVVSQQIAFVIKGGKAELRRVKIGESNDRMVEVLEGIDVGEVVVMNPKTHFEREIKELESQLIKDQAAKGAADSAAMPEIEAPTLPRPDASGTPNPAGPPAGPAAGSEGEARPAFDPLAMFQRMDTNSDGKLAADEWSERFKERAPALDKDGDGAISRAEFQSGIAGRPPGGPTNGLPPEQAGGG